MGLTFYAEGEYFNIILREVHIIHNRALILLLLIVTGCGSDPKTFQKQFAMDRQTKYVLTELKVASEKPLTTEGYPSIEEVQTRFDELFRQEFCTKLTCVTKAEEVSADDNGRRNVITVDVDVWYKRDILGKAYRGSSLDYMLTLHRDAKVIYTDNHIDIFWNPGIFGIVTTALKTATFSGRAGSEAKHINHLAPGIAGQVIQTLERNM